MGFTESGIWERSPGAGPQSAYTQRVFKSRTHDISVLLVSVEGLVGQEWPPAQAEETWGPLLVEGRKGYHREPQVEVVLGRLVVLRPPLEAAGRDGPGGVESRVPSRRMAEVRRALVGHLLAVEHMGLLPHSRGKERKGLLLLLTAPQSLDEGCRDQ